jgi:hypothetical protein
VIDDRFWEAVPRSKPRVTAVRQRVTGALLWHPCRTRWLHLQKPLAQPAWFAARLPAWGTFIDRWIMKTSHRTVALAALALTLTGCSASRTAGTTPTTVGATPGIPTTAPALPESSSTPGTPAASTATPQCRSAGLTVSLGAPEGAAGSVYRLLIFTNTGDQDCELTGFPGVSYVTGDDGHQVGAAAERVGDRGAAVHIAPGGTASAQLQLVNVGNYDPAVCHPTPVRGLRVYPPGETSALFVAAGGTGCAGTPGQQLTVKTITGS